MRRCANVLWWLVALFGATIACAQAQNSQGVGVVVTATKHGDAVEVDARAEVDASLPLIWATLTDYNRLHEFIPGIHASKVIGRRGNAAIVEQKGESKFAFFSFVIDVVVASIEFPPDRIDIKVEKGNLKRLDGGYRIVALPDKGPLRHLLEWKGLIEPDVYVPPLIGEMVMRANIEDQFSGMVREIVRRQALRSLPEKQ